MNAPVRYVATLVGASDSAIPNALLASARQALQSLGARDVARVDLSSNAVDLLFDLEARPADECALGEALRVGWKGERVDLVVQIAAYRRKKLLVADMDSTIIEQECIDELADHVGLREKVAAITDQAMRGEIAFEPALRERVSLLRGLEEAVIEQTFRDKIKITPGAKTLVATMRAHGALAALVSGGFTAFTGRVAQLVGFDENRANVLAVENGRLAGRVVEPILGRDAKLAALIELRERQDLQPEETLAVGDGANDLAMLQEAGLGVAFHAKPAVAAAARARIDHSDLTALLFIQGYKRSEFVEA